MENIISPTLEVCLFQTDLAWNQPKINLSNIEKAIKTLNHAVDLIVLPEMFNTAFVMNPSIIAEKPGGSTTLWMQQLAKKHQTVVAGSICIEENARFYNRFLAVFPDGRIFQYDKKHLFLLANETEYFTKGNQSITFEIQGWKIKPLICYDLRFPVWSKNQYHEGEFEYDCLIYVANWPTFRSYVWKSLLVARAMENQAYVIGVNRVGKDGNGIPHTGDSMVLDPKGKTVFAAPENQNILQCVTLQHEVLKTTRKDIDLGWDWDEFEFKN